MNLKKGDIVKNISKKTQHIVDCCESFDNITVVFTEDRKCFPISEVEKVIPLNLGDILLKMIQNKEITKEESNFIDQSLSKMNWGG